MYEYSVRTIVKCVCVCGELVEKVYGSMKLNEAQLKKTGHVHSGRFASGDNQIVRMQFFSFNEWSICAFPAVHKWYNLKQVFLCK